MNRRESLKFMLAVGTLMLAPKSFADVVSSSSDSSAALEKWKAMTPAQKEAMREKFKKFKALSTDEKQKLIENSKRFRNMPPEKQARIKANLARFENMTPEQRQKVRERFEKFKSMTPAERQKVRENIKERREKRMNSGQGAAGRPAGGFNKPNRR